MGNPEMGAKRSSDMEIKTPKVQDETLKFIKTKVSMGNPYEMGAKRSSDMQNAIATNSICTFGAAPQGRCWLSWGIVGLTYWDQIQHHFLQSHHNRVCFGAMWT